MFGVFSRFFPTQAFVKGLINVQIHSLIVGQVIPDAWFCSVGGVVAVEM
ncbi:hypothetical protein [Teichococcus wenyumeiae]|nr:hypothetical protein [Pseudoroseomonas wenyumeiae]